MDNRQIREFIIGHTAESLRPFIKDMDFTPVESCWCGGRLTDWIPEFVLYKTCPRCGCKSVRYRQTDESLKRFYTSNYWYEYQAIHRCPTIEQRFEQDMSDRIPIYLNWIGQLAKPASRVLEIGAGNGRLIHELSLKGYDCVATEMDVRISDWIAQKTGLSTVYTSELSPMSEPPFDVILLIDILEHINRQVYFVNEIKARLKNQGKVLLHCPVADSVETSLQLKHIFNPLSHLWIHTSDSLNKLWSGAGFKINRIGELFSFPAFVIELEQQ